MKWPRPDPSLAVLSTAVPLALCWDIGYRVFSFESMLVSMLGLVVATCLTFATRHRPAARGALVGLLFFSAIDIFFVEAPWNAWPLLLAGSIGMALLHARVPPSVVPAITLVFLVGIGLRPLEGLHITQKAESINGSAKTQIVVHLVLDEMGSFASVPAEYRVQADVDEISSAYRKRGFQLYTEKPSTSFETFISLSRTVDLPKDATKRANYSRKPNGTFRIKKNHLHERIASHGWAVNITQSQFLDFCTSSRFNCQTYAFGNISYAFADAQLPLAQRAAALGRELLGSLRRDERRSVWVDLLRDEFPVFFQEYGSWNFARPNPTLPFSMLNLLHRKAQEIASLSGRHYVFIHLLLPHDPWALGRNCTARPVEEWRDPDRAWSRETPADLPATFKAYWRQQYCTHKRVLALVDALDAAHPGQVQFLIHGDHGPRILARHAFGIRSTAEVLANPTLRNLMDPFIAARIQGAPDAAAATTLQETVRLLLKPLLQVEAPGAP